MASFRTKDLEDQLKAIRAILEDDPVSVDDNDGSITVDTDATPLDVDEQDIIDALEAAAYTDSLPQAGEHLKTRGHGVQPDGDLVGDKSSGEVDAFTADLAADEEVTIDGFTDSDGWSTIEVFVRADEQSAPAGVKVDYTDDVQGTQEVKATRTRTYTTEDATRGFETFKFETDLDGFRVRYENGGTPATDVDIITTLRTEPSPDAAGYVDKNTLGDTFVRVGTSAEEEGIKIGDPTSLFGDLETIERTTIVDSTSSFGTSVLRDEIITTGSASITENPDPDTGEIELATGATPDSEIDLRTAEYGRYTPGYSAQAGVGIRMPELWDEGEGRWGYFGDTNGFYFGWDADQGTDGELFVARLAGGTETERVYFSDFNGFDFADVFDKEFDPREGYIYQIDFSWYGYGIVNFQIVAQTTDTISARTPRQETIVVHSFAVTGETSTSDPNEPIEVELDNGANGDDNRLRVGGRQFSIFGSLPTDQRDTAETTDFSIPSGSWGHVMSWRRRDDAGDANARIVIDDFDIGLDQTTKYAIVVNADIGGTTFGQPELIPPDETLLEVSTAGTYNGIGNGTKAYEGSIRVAGQGNAQTTGSPDVDLAVGQANTISLIVQGIGGSGSGISTVRMLEDY